MSNDKPITLEQLFRYKQPWGKFPHQDAAIIEMEEDIQANGYAVAMRRDRPWFKAWSTSGKQPDPPLQQPPVKLSPSSHFSRRITPHFTIGEFALGQEARRFNHQYQVDTAAELAAFLERVRTAFGGKSVIITSGYRPPAVNRSVGGASASEHLYSAPSVGAVDFYVQGVDINAVQAWVDREWPFSVGYGAPKGFVHLGIRGAARPRIRWDY
jgi:hypothetical protein